MAGVTRIVEAARDRLPDRVAIGLSTPPRPFSLIMRLAAVPVRFVAVNLMIDGVGG
ncbi:hypothetical protein ACFFKH_06325 [Micromonospora marina]|uniref:hypothetical protein n=1 Tax=Micromonospora marina TaxID=307120 RepID=UPI000A3E0459